MSSSTIASVMGRTAANFHRREDIHQLQLAYDMEQTTTTEDQCKKKKALERLLWAFHQIQQLNPKNRNSYFEIASYHGMPFRGTGWGNPSW
jgi:hypothetical protein